MSQSTRGTQSASESADLVLAYPKSAGLFLEDLLRFMHRNFAKTNPVKKAVEDKKQHD